MPGTTVGRPSAGLRPPPAVGRRFELRRTPAEQLEQPALNPSTEPTSASWLTTSSSTSPANSSASAPATSRTPAAAHRSPHGRNPSCRPRPHPPPRRRRHDRRQRRPPQPTPRQARPAPTNEQPARTTFIGSTIVQDHQRNLRATRTITDGDRTVSLIDRASRQALLGEWTAAPPPARDTAATMASIAGSARRRSGEIRVDSLSARSSDG